MKLTKISLTLCIILLTSMAILALTQTAFADDNTVQFVGTGMPSGALWWVTYNGVTLYSTTNVITFTGVPDGDFAWSAQTTISGTSDVQYVALVNTGNLTAPAASPQLVNYTAQYRVTLASTNVDSDLGANFVGTSNVTGSTAGFTYSGVTGWVNNGAKLNFAYNSTCVVTPSVKQYVLLGAANATSGLTISAPTTITADYKTQYYVMFNQTGLGNDFSATSTVCTADGTNYNRNQINITSAKWYDSGATVTFAFTDPIVATANNKQYNISNVNATTGMTVTGRTTILATYVPCFYVTFTQNGIGTSYTNTDVMTVAGTSYGRAGTSVWVANNQAVVFSYSSSLVTGGSRYSRTGVNATSPLTITSKTTVTGNYSVQYFVNFTTNFIGSDYTATDVITVNGTSYGKTGMNGWYDTGTRFEFSFASPLTVSTGRQYTRTGTSHTTPITLSAGTTVYANYSGQYYLTVVSSHGVPSGEGWYTAGANVSFSADLSVSATSSTRYAFDKWSGDSTSTSATAYIIMDGAKTVTANWKTQYYIGVNSAHGTVSGAGWYDNGANVTLGISSVDDVGGGVRYVFTSWSDGSTNPTTVLTVSKAQNLTASWKVQYYLSVVSSQGSATGAGYYDADSTATFAVTSPVSGATSGTQYAFNGWTGDVSSTTSTASVVMDGPKSVTAHWKTQYFVTVTSTGAAASGEGWYDSGSTVTASVSSTDGFAGWVIDEEKVGYDSTLQTTVNAPMTIEATWGSTPPTYGINAPSTLILIGIIVAFVVVLVILLFVLRKH